MENEKLLSTHPVVQLVVGLPALLYVLMTLALWRFAGCPPESLEYPGHPAPSTPREASLVLIAADHDASPLLLLSDLAQHSRNIAFDPRVSLLFDGTAGHRDPLTGPRLTVIGLARAIEDPQSLARFTAHHPTSVLVLGHVAKRRNQG